MDIKSRRTMFAGVNFIVAPALEIDIDKRLNLEHRFYEAGINFSEYKVEGQQFIGIRKAPMPLQVSIGLAGPQIGQLLIIAPDLGTRSLGLVGSETQDIANICVEIWPSRQVIACDATVRDLYDSTSEHAFQELWETRLKQPPNSILAFSRPVLGGGLRFVMPPRSAEPSEALVELKIESFLNDSRKIFIEVQFKWPIPQPIGAPLDPEDRLVAVDNFLQHEVMNFFVES